MKTKNPKKIQGQIVERLVWECPCGYVNEQGEFNFLNPYAICNECGKEFEIEA